MLHLPIIEPSGMSTVQIDYLSVDLIHDIIKERMQIIA